jgi:hypothetical protein
LYGATVYNVYPGKIGKKALSTDGTCDWSGKEDVDQHTPKIGRMNRERNQTNKIKRKPGTKKVHLHSVRKYLVEMSYMQN